MADWEMGGNASVIPAYTLVSIPVPQSQGGTGASSLGAAVVTSTGSTASRTTADRFADVVNVKDFGAVGNGVANDTAAIAAAVSAVGGNKQGIVFFPPGTYRSDTISLPSWCSLIGSGWLNTTIRPIDNDHNLVLLDRVTGSTWGYQNEIRGLHLWGYATGTGAGIYGTGDRATAIGPSGLRIRDTYIDGFGGNGLHLEAAWDTTIQNVHSSNNVGHQFFIDVAINCVQFIGCYAKGIPTAGKAGYKVNEGRVTLINCNGIDTGDYWGIFGLESADGDDRDANAFVHLIGCNVEDAKVRGLWFKRNAQWQVDSTTFVGPTSPATPIAIYFNNYNNNNPGVIGAGCTFSIKAGGAWADTFALHAFTAPGMMKFGIGITNVWDENAGYSVVMPCLYGIDGDGVLRLNGGVVLGTSASAEKLKSVISGTATWDAGSVSDGAMTSTTVTVTGADLGDIAHASLSVAVPAGALLAANVTATNTVTVTLLNHTGAPLDLASGTLLVNVWQN